MKHLRSVISILSALALLTIYACGSSTDDAKTGNETADSTAKEQTIDSSDNQDGKQGNDEVPVKNPDAKYCCPVHVNVCSDEPGVCTEPGCGMDLEPIKEY